MRDWRIVLRGGDFDGFVGFIQHDPRALLIAWSCGPRCDGHATFDVAAADIVLDSALAYRLAETDEEERRAVYEVGDVAPSAFDGDAARELVGAGSDARAA